MKKKMTWDGHIHVLTEYGGEINILVLLGSQPPPPPNLGGGGGGVTEQHKTDFIIQNSL